MTDTSGHRGRSDDPANAQGLEARAREHVAQADRAATTDRAAEVTHRYKAVAVLRRLVDDGHHHVERSLAEQLATLACVLVARDGRRSAETAAMAREARSRAGALTDPPGDPDLQSLVNRADSMCSMRTRRILVSVGLLLLAAVGVGLIGIGIHVYQISTVCDPAVSRCVLDARGGRIETDMGTGTQQFRNVLSALVFGLPGLLAIGGAGWLGWVHYEEHRFHARRYRRR